MVYYTRLFFRIKCKANENERVYVVGNILELGQWDPYKAIEMVPFDEDNIYNLFYTINPIYVKLKEEIEYNYIKINNKNEVIWCEEKNKVIIATGYDMFIEDDEGLYRSLHNSFNTIDHNILKHEENLEKKLKLIHDLGRKQKLDEYSRIFMCFFKLPLLVKIENEEVILEKNKNSMLSILFEQKSKISEKLFFIGYPGIYVECDELKKKIIERLDKENCIPIFLPKKETKEFIKYCNENLLFLFHNIFDIYKQESFDTEGWQNYKLINKIFYDSMMKYVETFDYVWINSYRLLLLPSYLSKKSYKIPTAFFFHIPFPSSEIYRLLPQREEILRSLLSCDLIGFNTFEYARHFLVISKKLLNLDFYFKLGGVLTITYCNRDIVVKILHEQIEPSIITNILNNSNNVDKNIKLLKHITDKKYTFGCYERGNIFNGLLFKIKAFNYFLENYEYARGNVILVQYISANSLRSLKTDVIFKEIQSLVDEINKKYHTYLKNKKTNFNCKTSFANENDDEIDINNISSYSISNNINSINDDAVISNNKGDDIINNNSKENFLSIENNFTLLEGVKRINEDTNFYFCEQNVPKKLNNENNITLKNCNTNSNNDLKKIDEEKIYLNKQNYKRKGIISNCKNIYLNNKKKYLSLYKMCNSKDSSYTHNFFVNHLKYTISKKGKCKCSNGNNENNEEEKLNKKCELNDDEKHIILKISELNLESKYFLFQCFDCFLDTSIRDNFNLNPFEYIVCKQYSNHANCNNINKKKKNLILSEMSSCSSILSSPIRINPWNIEKVAEAMDQAINFNKNKRKQFKIDALYVEKLSTTKWCLGILNELKNCRKEDNKVYISWGFGNTQRLFEIDRNFKYLDANMVIHNFKKSRKRLILLDCEGTLLPDYRNVHLFGEELSAIGIPPSEDIIKCLNQLIEDKNTTVIILSGRDKNILDSWFKDVPKINLCAELGFYYKNNEITGGNWRQTSKQNDFTWKIIVSKLMKEYAKRTQGAIICNKGSSLVFQYRNADPHFGSMQAKELHTYLKDFLIGYPVSIVNGKGYLEVKLNNIDKGKIVIHILSLYEYLGYTFDSILCIGDDISDEDMFRALKSWKKNLQEGEKNSEQSENNKNVQRMDTSLFTCTVGMKPSDAQYYLNDTEEVYDLLKNLASL
ncbi:glycosyltransferase, putative [Plasmodium relictum]|uniref:Glycosyltransferase, putative n=1 Tax=Plasmodium relictum TaxID=85471 RepID=A0A1J1H9F1_PLARL|nr:glycosyltransferase, putative [Plasmodium relictum]CRH01135.1 glycosyltransferase, putative [Plasmodium relictum]